MVAISFARLQEERLNHEAWRTRVAPQPVALRHSVPLIVSRPSAPKKLTREELRERSAKGLCWHCDEPWSRNHRCRKGRLLAIEPIKEEDLEHEEESLDHEEKDEEEEPQPTDCMVYALVGYANPQTMKFGAYSYNSRSPSSSTRAAPITS
ncbi:hypothetical protein B296_00001601 [Ensete ventricosum]|uniref:Uncharacterized protein n=1 Tax=Ensete ventricosum TaxID=4639 RepID=A0A427A2I0_ENSVE|nr:hypothetical protein B296_00001601 [Ensete ventricosum]